MGSLHENSSEHPALGCSRAPGRVHPLDGETAQAIFQRATHFEEKTDTITYRFMLDEIILQANCTKFIESLQARSSHSPRRRREPS
uniref:Uncharacterized protein n=1 Tax=Setaria italica TaxID=4555 RepID=K3YX81_SETIT